MTQTLRKRVETAPAIAPESNEGLQHQRGRNFPNVILDRIRLHYSQPGYLKYGRYVTDSPRLCCVSFTQTKGELWLPHGDKGWTTIYKRRAIWTLTNTIPYLSDGICCAFLWILRRLHGYLPPAVTYITTRIMCQGRSRHLSSKGAKTSAREALESSWQVGRLEVN